LSLRLNHELDPVWEVKVTGESVINPSEDPKRVVKCITNTINGGEQSLEDSYVVVRSKGILALHHIRVGVKLRLSAGVLRRLIDYNRSGNSTWFLLNKQAAYCGVIAVVENWTESSLGPIKVTIKSSDLDRVLTWLLPSATKIDNSKFHRNELKDDDTVASRTKY
jgi:uncharacterized protein